MKFKFNFEQDLWQRHMCVNNLSRVDGQMAGVEPITFWPRVWGPN